jgi:hypothetical protein
MFYVRRGMVGVQPSTDARFKQLLRSAMQRFSKPLPTRKLTELLERAYGAIAQTSACTALGALLGTLAPALARVRYCGLLAFGTVPCFIP